MRLLVALAYILHAGWHALATGTNDYESEYLALGSAVWRGTLSLYADDFTSQWMPLPFWLYGLAGDSLLAGRIMAILVGGAALWLAMSMATQLANSSSVGAVAGLLTATHGGLVGTLSRPNFEGLVMLELTGLVWCLLARRRYAAMLICGAIFLTKPNYWPVIPLALVYAIIQHEATDYRSRWEPLGLTAVCLLPVSLFFAFPEHWKILAYTPLSGVVESSGWRPWFGVMEPGFWKGDYTDGSILGALKLLAKRFWLWGVLVLVGLLAGGWKRIDRHTIVIGTLFLWLLVWQFVIMGPWVKQAVAYMHPMMPLVAGVVALVVMPRRKERA